MKPATNVETPEKKAKHPQLIKLRTGFVAGLLMLAPLGITVFVFAKIFKWAGAILRPLFQGYLPQWIRPDNIVWDILSTLVLTALITSIGLVSRYFLSKWFLGFVDRFMRGIPGVSTVYGAVKQIIDTVSAQNQNAFSKVVLVEFPRKGMYSVGFLTNKVAGEAQAKTAVEVWSVFVPTTPNPTTGFLVMLPRNEIIELDMTPGEGMKLIVSGGVVTPPWPPQQKTDGATKAG